MPTGFDSAWVSRQPGAGDTKRSRALGGLADPSRLNSRVGRSISTAAGRSARILGRDANHYRAVPALAPFRSRPKPGLTPTPLSGAYYCSRSATAASGTAAPCNVCDCWDTDWFHGAGTGGVFACPTRPAPRRLPHGLTRCQRATFRTTGATGPTIPGSCSRSTVATARCSVRKKRRSRVQNDR